VLPPAERLPSGYRLYPEAAVTTIALARRLQSLGLTLDEVADALRAHVGSGAGCESERWRLVAALERTRARIAELATVQHDIEAVLARCEAGCCELRGTPAGPAGRRQHRDRSESRPRQTPPQHLVMPNADPERSGFPAPP